MVGFFKCIYISNLFFYLGSAIVFSMVLGFFFPGLIEVSWLLMIGLVLSTLVDSLLLYRLKNGIIAERRCSDRLSNGDENKVAIEVLNNYQFGIQIKIIDEIPYQFQVRDFLMTENIKAGKSKIINYALFPKTRGKFHFGSMNIFVSTSMGLIKRKFQIEQGKEVAVYPSYIHLNKYDINQLSNSINFPGIKKMRRLGHSMEFEQIKEYVQGDDWRSVNWLATSKSNKLMVNQYMEEKAQSVYCIIDTGRVMKMPFNGLNLLDHSINCALIISHVVISNQDKAGLATFSRKLENRVVADRRFGQMHNILEKLYRVQTDFSESDYGRLFVDLKKFVSQQSLLILFSNFETIDGLKRQLKYLRAIAKNHLLLIVFFKNSEIEAMMANKSEDIHGIYDKAIAEKFSYEKKLIVNELRKYGIMSVLTEPQNLTIDVINKYLEVKARGMI